MANVEDPRKKFRERVLPNWDVILKEIFPVAYPASCVWKEKAAILSILNKVGSMPNLNHMFMPSGGGEDLTGAAEAGEPGAIALLYGDIGADIVKPSALYFESFGDDYQWSYFRLETEGLPPSGIYNHLENPYEEVTELEPGYYVERSVWDRGYVNYDEYGREVPLPRGARPVFRYFDGAFVIFAKGSIYNAVSSTYDARHNKMTGEQFRQYIEKNVQALSARNQSQTDTA